MPYSPNAVGTSTATAASISAETVVATAPTFSATPEGGQGYYLTGSVTFQGNASASTAVLKVRQGNSTSGTAVFTSPAYTVAAGAVVSLSFDCVDPTQGGVNDYCVTLTPSAATQALAGCNSTIAVTPTGGW